MILSGGKAMTTVRIDWLPVPTLARVQQQRGAMSRLRQREKTVAARRVHDDCGLLSCC